MSLLKIDKTKLVEPRAKTTPENVQEANEALFRAKMTLPAAAKHCGDREGNETYLLGIFEVSS